MIHTDIRLSLTAEEVIDEQLSEDGDSDDDDELAKGQTDDFSEYDDESEFAGDQGW